MLKQQIDQDLKKALLAGDKQKVTTLRGLKSVILYAEVAKGIRDTGLDDASIVTLFAKETKKRQESADIYAQAGHQDRANAELNEKKIIEEYMPQQLSDEALVVIIDKVIQATSVVGPQAMGKVIAEVKQQTSGQADGARVAQFVKQQLKI